MSPYTSFFPLQIPEHSQEDRSKKLPVFHGMFWLNLTTYRLRLLVYISDGDEDSVFEIIIIFVERTNPEMLERVGALVGG